MLSIVGGVPFIPLMMLTNATGIRTRPGFVTRPTMKTDVQPNPSCGTSQGISSRVDVKTQHKICMPRKDNRVCHETPDAVDGMGAGSWWLEADDNSKRRGAKTGSRRNPISCADSYSGVPLSARPSLFFPLRPIDAVVGSTHGDRTASRSRS